MTEQELREQRQMIVYDFWDEIASVFDIDHECKEMLEDTLYRLFDKAEYLGEQRRDNELALLRRYEREDSSFYE